MSDSDWIWLAIGASGQALFGLRMLVQWWMSERAGRSLVPRLYWFLSIAGGGILLAYAIGRKDPVFILGQTLGLWVYYRNLMLGGNERSRWEAPTRDLGGDFPVSCGLGNNARAEPQPRL